ncbi:MAG: four helix bundle protein [Nibricoccus sp.]
MKNAETDLKERTRAFALRVIKLYSALPSAAAAQVLGKQLLRSGTSVGANYREAHRARSKAEFIAKMGDCLKELDESSYWLDLLATAELVPATRLSALIDETNQLTAIFVTIIKNTKSGQSSDS